MINVCLVVFITCHLLFWTTIAFSKTKFLNFGWPFNRGKDNRKTLTGTTKRWQRPLNGGARIIGVLLAVFY